MDVARLLVPSWALLLIHCWVALPPLLAAGAGAIAGEWTQIGLRNRLLAVTAGVFIGYPAAWVVLALGDYTDSPGLLWFILAVPPILGAIAYLVTSRTYHWLRIK
jgi:hypothetical protein